jgi:UDP-N-acetyl-D-glucosamine dehydrogenase
MANIVAPTAAARPVSRVAREELLECIETRRAIISVIGQGYVGLPLALEFARTGFTVHGIDVNSERVAMLGLGQSHISDVDSADIRALLRTKRYNPTSDFAVLERSDVIIICVPTPLSKSKDPDMSFVIDAAERAAARFRPRQLVILESTTFPGTTQEILLPMFEARGARAGEDFFLVFSPERIDPGNPQFKVRDIPKVVGGLTPACTFLATALYRQIVGRVVEVSSPMVAELAKLYENVFRNINIALANEFALMCRHLGVASREVIEAAATKPFGFLPFYPGPGIGGHCIGIDPIYLAWKVKANGFQARFIGLAEEINRAMPRHVVTLAAEALNERRRCLNGARVLVFGVAYKRGVPDTRESPALEIIAMLRSRGADVSYADPYVPSIVLDDGTLLKSVEPSCHNVGAADCVVIVTDHPADYQAIIDASQLVIDTRSATWGLSIPAGRVVTL